MADSTQKKRTIPPLDQSDYYINEMGYLVFTTSYHLKRGYCCQNGCKHCPYGFRKKEDLTT